MNGRSKYPGPAGSVKLLETIATKGKRKAVSDDHYSPTPGPSSLLGMTPPSPEARRKLPKLAPKPSSINPDPDSTSLVESEPLQLHIRLRGDLDPLTPPTPTEQPMYPTNHDHDTWSHSDIDTSFNTLPIANVIQDSDSQSFGRLLDPFSGIQNAPQAAILCPIDPPLVPQITTIVGGFQMPNNQDSVRCCPRCHATLRNLRGDIITIISGLPGGEGALGELLKSYFALEDHLNERHASRPEA